MDGGRGTTLLRLARHAIEASFADRPAVVPPDPWLHAPGAAFVTLRLRPDGSLRGCVGTIEAERPLGDAIVTAAVGAAFRDTRFGPLGRQELSLIRLDVSVLSPLSPLPVTDEADAIARIGRTRPGVVLSCGWRRGVFLPKVWESLPEAAEFLRHLKVKAGLSARYWSADVELAVFTCDEFAESDDRREEEEAS